MRINTSFVVLANLLTCAFAGSAIVANNCDFPVFVRSIQAGGETTFKTVIGLKTSYSEPFLGAGRAIKLSKEDMERPGLPVAHLIFGYTFESTKPGVVWTSLANSDGAPFFQRKIVLTGSCNDGDSIEWDNGVGPDGIDVKNCDSNQNLYLSLCA